jgi:hypothetical protein
MKPAIFCSFSCTDFVPAGAFEFPSGKANEQSLQRCTLRGVKELSRASDCYPKGVGVQWCSFSHVLMAICSARSTSGGCTGPIVSQATGSGV